MRWVLLFVLVSPLILSCSGNETVEPVNKAPTIEFTFEQIAVEKDTRPDLTVEVSDPDGDPLTVSWDITGGTLEEQNSQKTVMRWTPPRGVGADTVVVRVSDGEATASTGEVVLKRATWERSENVGENLVLEKRYSPYVLEPWGESVTISRVVTIEDSVEIYIGKENLEIIVIGTLQSNGTAAKPVVIQPNERLSCLDGRKWWGGILVTTQDLATGFAGLTYTEISHATSGVRVRYDASASLDHCTIFCCDEAGVKMESNGTLTVDRCEIKDNTGNGIEISSISDRPSPVVTITESHILFNARGIYMDLQDGTKSSTINVTYNLIERNNENGIQLAHQVWPTIERNDFRLNNSPIPLLHMRLETNFGREDGGGQPPPGWDTLLVPNNYWGQPFDPGEVDRIKDTIYDAERNAAIPTTIDVDPWQNEKQSPY
jgi:hypothetical protein